eukprot:CAMPEP_0194551352 /NCGR_PEP_ID=MMETSP0253-20130528/96180_1 /TAXON_ID=2966 /ORGANISM="Noctiluca scintillans" /LENGTH=467 /DNA_ID=CAMNT_0039398809 /DNA_START=35 /DNA_END=1438 /DNA_ORIENTATION=-
MTHIPVRGSVANPPVHYHRPSLGSGQAVQAATLATYSGQRLQQEVVELGPHGGVLMDVGPHGELHPHHELVHRGSLVASPHHAAMVAAVRATSITPTSSHAPPHRISSSPGQGPHPMGAVVQAPHVVQASSLTGHVVQATSITGHAVQAASLSGRDVAHAQAGSYGPPVQRRPPVDPNRAEGAQSRDLQGLQGGQDPGAQSTQGQQGGLAPGAQSTQGQQGGLAPGAQSSQGQQGGLAPGAQSTQGQQGGQAPGAQSAQGQQRGQALGAQGAGAQASNKPQTTTNYPANVGALLDRLDGEKHTGGGQAGRTAEEIAWAKKILEQEAQLADQDNEIKELQASLESMLGDEPKHHTRSESRRGTRNSVSGAANSEIPQGQPVKKYKSVDSKDPVDVQLEKFYNATSSAVPFKRINKGFYRFGETTLELKIVNGKLMVQTEDGWNRGKFGAIEKFMGSYESSEREKAGIE